MFDTNGHVTSTSRQLEESCTKTVPLCICVDRYRCILAATTEDINIGDQGHKCEDLRAMILELHLGTVQRPEED
jgi:hypothetical protein